MACPGKPGTPFKILESLGLPANVLQPRNEPVFLSGQAIPGLFAGSLRYLM
jgi:hypothetical protein